LGVKNEKVYLFYSKLTENTSGVKNDKIIYTDDFRLDNNYPNPFNPSTKIDYVMKKSAFVKIIFCDIPGKEIKTLVNEKVPMGNRSVTFNTGSLADAVYFIKMITDSYIDVKKCVLLK
jgi:hypothetical protein